jgi:hypothetical protein
VCAAEVLSTLPADQQAITLARLGCCRARLQQFTQAEPVLVEAEKRLAETGQGGSEMMRAVYRALADVCDRTNRPQDAAAWRARLAAIPSSQPTTQ